MHFRIKNLQWQIQDFLEGEPNPVVITYYYRPQQSLGKVMFLHMSVILFMMGSASLHAGIHPQDQRQAPPGADTPMADTPIPGRHPHPRQTPPSQADTPIPGRHPLEQYMLGGRATSRRYASYWNAILFGIVFS